MTSLTAFLTGFVATFLGTLPFGPINLSVVDTTIKDSFRAALILSIAAALVEIVMSFIAVHCSVAINQVLENGSWVKIAAIALFIGLGLFFFFKRESKKGEEKDPKKTNPFWKGLIIALLNPQAIPFWIFVLTYLSMSHIIELNTSATQISVILTFLVGVAFGKLAALLLFALLSKLISKRSAFLGQWMNKIIGSILLAIGLFQGIQLIAG